ncbi:AraC family transcriptional regulator [Paenibacillus sp. SC116]|uniref:AraC family transcriptional regulator n=1 Tax=Paenibacillus sp. SC116 TaxID=2968986 RepID=UPI00215B769A|nr:AraC family transcriptional regulator [Paenibacillus sp. SC116]MCR8844523.1 AraC family transcriptional regulator [Paenibacillus sp. SC116]
MDWVARMNEAINYIEEHITEDISYSEVAKVACCSTYHFQRMFSFITEVPLSEYIRRRRLTLAAFELQNSQEKVIDLALKYGYDSPEAFTRAFQQLHGTTPTAARSVGTQLKAYPRLSFQISIKGVVAMDYRIEEVGSFTIVGQKEHVSHKDSYQVIPQLWVEAQGKGLFETLLSIRNESNKINGILGVCANGNWGQNDGFDYYMAIASDQELPDGLVKIDIPAATWAEFESTGAPQNIQESWKRLYTEWLPVSSYDFANLPAIESYLPPEENKNELWIPVVKKQ